MLKDLGTAWRWTLAIGVAVALSSVLSAGQTNQPSVQYRSPEGVEYRSLPDTDAVKSARAAFEADPKNIARIIDFGVAQSGARQFREAIATFTRGLEIEPDNALLLRWRGHRYLSVREFDRAFADLKRGAAIDSTIYGIWYHLGVIQFLRGDFSDAAASFAKAQPIAPDAGELAGSTDWLWMSLSRAAFEIGERAIEFTHGQISMPAPSQELRIVRLDLQTSRERGNRLAKLPGAGLGHAEVDDARNVLRVGLECDARARDGVGVGKRPILHAFWRSVLHRRLACLPGTEHRRERNRHADHERPCHR